MADISNLKINERANVEWPNLRVQYENRRIDEQIQNLLIFGILIFFQIKRKI